MLNLKNMVAATIDHDIYKLYNYISLYNVIKTERFEYSFNILNGKKHNQYLLKSYKKTTKIIDKYTKDDPLFDNVNFIIVPSDQNCSVAYVLLNTRFETSNTIVVNSSLFNEVAKKYIPIVDIPKNMKEKFVLYHERGHLEQIRDGRLRLDNKYQYWKNKKYTIETINEISSNAFKSQKSFNRYKNLPWEVDANRFALKHMYKG